MKEKCAIYIVLTLFVVISLAIGTYHLVSIVNKTEGKEMTDAVVIGYKKRMKESTSTSHGGMVYAEVVEYVVDGITYTAQNNAWSYPPKKEVGETMKIAYDPNDPQNCVFVNSEMILPIGVYAICAVGLALLIAQIVGDVKKIKAKKLMKSIVE